MKGNLCTAELSFYSLTCREMHTVSTQADKICPRDWNLNIDNTGSVSYTHLDVYKRQSVGYPVSTYARPIVLTTAPNHILSYKITERRIH